MAPPTNRRMSAKITLHGNGSAAVSVLLIETDGKQTPLSVPPLGHLEALEGFIYALAAQHGIAPDAIDIAVDDRRSPFHGHQPPGQVH